MMDYKNLATNVKMTRSTIQVPSLKSVTISSTTIANLDTAIATWVADAANKFKAIVSIDTFVLNNVASPSGGAAITDPVYRTEQILFYSNEYATLALAKAGIDAFLVANPGKYIIDAKVVQLGEVAGGVNFGNVGILISYIAVRNEVTISTTFTVAAKVWYYDYSPVDVPDPSQGMAVPPPCACG